MLQNIITNTKISKQTVGQAEELANSIAKYVTVEKAKQAIIGTWKKETGVCYTFEEDGHMSVSVPGAYNPSAGTTLDGAEVRQVVSEIENYGRPLRGGTWEYLQGEEFEKVYEEQGLLGGYSLYYDGSEFSCALKSVNGTTVMGIQLISGIGEMSFLTRVN